MAAYSRGDYFSKFSVEIPIGRRKNFTRLKYLLYLANGTPSAEVGKAEVSKDGSLLNIFMPADIHINMLHGMSICCSPLDGEVSYVLVGPARLTMANVAVSNGF